jgi:hypothetical protein
MASKNADDYFVECLDSRVKSNPVFSGAIILASLLESYYQYQFCFGFWESVWTASNFVTNDVGSLKSNNNNERSCFAKVVAFWIEMV